MKYIMTKTVKEQVNIATLEASMEVRHWEDAKVNGIEDKDGSLIPLRKGDNWHIVINIDTGRIKDWTEGVGADVHYKVCDAGVYRLCTDDNQLVSECQAYVPAILCPCENGYGDYVIMKIDKDGYIQGWKVTDKMIDELMADYTGRSDE